MKSINASISDIAPCSSGASPVLPHDQKQIGDRARLLSMVADRAADEGRTDSLYPGLRYYRFSGPIECSKTQLLMPGIVVILQGRKTARLGAHTLSYDELNFLVLGCEVTCNGTVVEASAAYPYLAIHLDLPPDLLVKTFIALADTRKPVEPADVTASFVSPIDANVIEALLRLLPATDDPMDRDMIAPLIVEEIIVRLLRSEAAAAIRSAAGIARTAIRIQSAMQFIREHLAQPLSVDQLAAQVAMSPSHFAHSFREISGVSPMRYLRDLRLDAARNLMLGGGMRAGDAAAKVGFESAAHFAREFKNRFDATPTEYLRRVLGQKENEVRRIGQ